VRDLFFNTPARLKFMKADRSEASACVSVALRCALGRPEVSVRLIKDGSDEFFSPGDGKISSCTYSLLGRETAMELLECSTDDEGLSVSGFVGSPKAGHGNRTKQFFFCNGRSIKSQILQTAVEQAYKNTLLTGRYPSCVIYLALSFGSVDVNVHPAKTEVKFRDEKKVFDAVYYAALSAIEGESRAAEIRLSTSTKAVVSPIKDFFRSMGSTEFREKYADAPKAAGPAFAPRPASPSESGADRGTIVWNRTPGKTAGGTAVRESETPYRMEKTVFPDYGFPVPSVPVEAAGSIEGARADFRLIGEAMKTYIIVETGNEILLIDKHAAHERMIFDALKAQGLKIMSQSLLVPATVRLPADEIELLEQNAEALAKLGFEIEPYGTDSVILRGVPADTDAADAAPMLEEICGKLRKHASLSQGEALDEILHTVACKAAVKAGWNTADDELTEIVKAVVSGKVRYCPHGRPVSITLTKKQLDKEFSRIV